MIYFEIGSEKSLPTYLFVLNERDVCNVLKASSTICYELFHSWKLVLKLILNDNERGWFDFQVGYEPQKINFHHQKS